MSSVTREALMAYCRVDDDAAGDILMELCNSAEAYLSSAGIPLSEVAGARCELAVKALVLHWFDNPTGGDLPAGLRQLINQLKFTQ